MDVKRIMPYLIPTRGKISKLVSEILIIEEKLININEQSQYFQWALTSHNKRHRELLDQYASVRQEFNEMSLDELIGAVAENKNIFRQKSNLNSKFISSIVKHLTLDRISKTTEFITLKSFTDVLPEFEILRDDAELLRDILP